MSLFNKMYTNLFLKLKKVEFGKNPNLIGNKPLLTNNGKLKIGDNFRVRSLQFKTELACLENAELIMGNDVFINHGANICASKSITIGSNVHIADLVMMHDSNFHEVEEGKGITTKPIVIGNNVWIGARSIILPGVEIGENSVIAAGSVVTKSIPENCLAAGVPAKILRYLNCGNNYIRT